MADFVLKPQSAAYWDKVSIPVKSEDGSWRDVVIEVKFKRLKRKELEASLEGRSEARSEGAFSVEYHAERVLSVLDDWKVADESGQKVPVSLESLLAIADAIPGSLREIDLQFTRSSYGVKEKN